MEPNKIICKITTGGIIQGQSCMPLSDFYRLFGSKYQSGNLVVRGADLVDMINGLNNNKTGI
jgi:hypothetical protein